MNEIAARNRESGWGLDRLADGRWCLTWVRWADVLIRVFADGTVEVRDHRTGGLRETRACGDHVAGFRYAWAAYTHPAPPADRPAGEPAGRAPRLRTTQSGGAVSAEMLRALQAAAHSRLLSTVPMRTWYTTSLTGAEESTVSVATGAALRRRGLIEPASGGPPRRIRWALTGAGRAAVDATAAVGADVVGGLEVRRFPGARSMQWRILLDGTELAGALRTDLKRRAVALRGLLLDVVPDWSALPRTPGGRLAIDEATRHRLTWIARMARNVDFRRATGLCLGCGHGRDATSCTCGGDAPGDGAKYTAEQLAWAR